MLLTLGAWGRANAQDATATSPDALVAEGVALRRLGDDEAALARFTRAHSLAPAPRTRAQMALAEQALGRFGLAEAHLVEALRARGDPWIESHRATLEQALETIRRRREENAAVAATPRAGPRPARARTTEREQTERAASRSPDDVRARRRPIAWALLGAGAGGWAASTVAYGIRERRARSWNDDDCLVGDTRRGDSCAHLRESAVRAQRTSGIAFGVGTALITSGIVLLIVPRTTTDDTTDARARARPACAAGFGPRWEGACTWRF